MTTNGLELDEEDIYPRADEELSMAKYDASQGDSQHRRTGQNGHWEHIQHERDITVALGASIAFYGNRISKFHAKVTRD